MSPVKYGSGDNSQGWMLSLYVRVVNLRHMSGVANIEGNIFDKIIDVKILLFVNKHKWKITSFKRVIPKILWID